MLEKQWLVRDWPSGGPSVQTDRQTARWPNIFTGLGAPTTDRPGGKTGGFPHQNKHTQQMSTQSRMECDFLITDIDII